MKLTSRQWFAISLLLVIATLGIAAYFEWVLNYEPCPLCILQRVCFLLYGIVTLIIILHHPKKLGIRIYSILLLLIAALGTLIAGRQVWLQHLPSETAPSCGAGLNFILNELPPTEAIHTLFYGSADCAHVEWQFLGLSLAGWSFCLFALLGAIAIIQLVRPKRRIIF